MKKHSWRLKITLKKACLSYRKGASHKFLIWQLVDESLLVHKIDINMKIIIINKQKLVISLFSQNNETYQVLITFCQTMLLRKLNWFLSLLLRFKICWCKNIHLMVNLLWKAANWANNDSICPHPKAKFLSSIW